MGRFYFSAIFTTAEILLARLDPATIDLASAKNTETVAIPWVRFRKQFAVHPNENARVLDSRNLAKAREHTVFVVKADHFVEFLEQFEVDEMPFNQ